VKYSLGVPPLTRLLMLMALVAAFACDGVFHFDDDLPTVSTVEGGAPPPPLDEPDASADSAGEPPDSGLPVDAPFAAADLRPAADVAPRLDRAPDLVAQPNPVDSGEMPGAPLVGWNVNQCVNPGCNLECRDNPSCSGSCGATCLARCRNSTSCSLTTAANANLECRETSACDFVISGGTVRCREAAQCNVRCLGPCTVNCEDANCELQCAADAAPSTVTGTVGCP
jgi:hypothetical protein